MTARALAASGSVRGVTWRDLLASLHAVAAGFSERLERPRLAEPLAHGDPAAPVQPWTVALMYAERLAARGEPEAAAQVLSAESARLRADALARDRLLATTLAYLARAEAAAGREREALPAMAEAMELWRRAGDGVGVLSALESLVALERRAHEVEAAARHARALASELEVAGEVDKAQRYRALARSLGRPRGPGTRTVG